MSSKTNMIHNINRTLQVVVDDRREVTGRLLIYDQHMNVVLADAVETRPETRKMKEEGISPVRTLGLILLRGEHVVSVTVLKGQDAGGDEKRAGQSAANFERAPKSRKAGAKRAREE